ncbi:hypothetical protein AB0L22_08040 [Micromonospora haikouensis]|uniref:hypothetical protein n=1 Tax=Micromonospora haikouensis TaxID=686309 RepID=UPI0034161F2D
MTDFDDTGQADEGLPGLMNLGPMLIRLRILNDLAGQPSGATIVSEVVERDAVALRRVTDSLWRALLAEANIGLIESARWRMRAAVASGSLRPFLVLRTQVRKSLPEHVPWAHLRPSSDDLRLIELLTDQRTMTFGVARMMCEVAMRLQRRWRTLRRVMRLADAAPKLLLGAGLFALGGVAVDKTLGFGWFGACALALGLWSTENYLVEPRVERWTARRRIGHLQWAVVQLGEYQLKSVTVPYLADWARIEMPPPPPPPQVDVVAEYEKELAAMLEADALRIGDRVRVSFMSLGLTVAEGVIRDITTTEHGAAVGAPMYLIEEDDGRRKWHPGILLDRVS